MKSKIQNIFQYNYLLHRNFDKLRLYKKNNLLLMTIFFLCWFFIVVLTIVLGVWMIELGGFTTVIGVMWLVLLLVSRFCAIVSSDLYKRRKERKIKERAVI